MTSVILSTETLVSPNDSQDNQRNQRDTIPRVRQKAIRKFGKSHSKGPFYPTWTEVVTRQERHLLELELRLCLVKAYVLEW